MKKFLVLQALLLALVLSGCNQHSQAVYTEPVIVSQPVVAEVIPTSDMDAAIYQKYLLEIKASSQGPRNNSARDRVFAIGLNRFKMPMPLSGCVNDAYDWSIMFAIEYGFKTDAIVVCTDDNCEADEIRAGLDWLYADIRPGDRRVFIHSGHGAQFAGPGSDTEPDRLLEVLVSYNFDWNDTRTMITDKELYPRFKKAIEQGGDLVFISDACHSGGYSREVPVKGRKNKTIVPPPKIAANIRKAKRSKRAVLEELDMVCIFACKEEELSADSSDENGRPCGAFSLYEQRAIRNAKKAEPERTIKSVTRGVSINLGKMGYDQSPQTDGKREDAVLYRKR